MVERSRVIVVVPDAKVGAILRFMATWKVEVEAVSPVEELTYDKNAPGGGRKSKANNATNRKNDAVLKMRSLNGNHAFTEEHLLNDWVDAGMSKQGFRLWLKAAIRKKEVKRIAGGKLKFMGVPHGKKNA